MNDVIFVMGPSGLNKLDVAKKIDALMPDERFIVLSSSDIRETLRSNPIFAAYKSLASSTIGSGNSVELLEQQSRLLAPTIEKTINYHVQKKQNVIVAGTTLLPNLYNVDANVQNYMVYTDDFQTALQSDQFQKHKLKYLNDLKAQQEYLLKSAKQHNIPTVQYFNNQDPAHVITRKFRANKNPALDFSTIKPQDIAISIMGVTGCGKTTVARELVKNLDSYLEGISLLSTDSPRASLRASMIDTDATASLVSSHQLNETQLYRQSEIMKPYLQSIQKRRKERGSPIIMEGVNAPKADAKYPVNILLVSSEENLRKRFQMRGSPTDSQKLEKIKEIMGFQKKLISEAQANGWKIIENDGTPEMASGKIMKELEGVMAKKAIQPQIGK